MMREPLGELNDILSEQLECVTSLLNLAREETAALQENNVHRLSQICERMTEIAGELAALEQKRIEAHDRLASFFDLPQGCTLKQLLTALSSVEDSDLINNISIKAQNLSIAYGELQEQNHLNKLLLKQSISYVNRLYEALGPDITYSKGCKISRKNNSASLINYTV